MMVCPKCGGEFGQLLAVSRVDSKTRICDMCGTREALEEYTDEIRKQGTNRYDIVQHMIKEAEYAQRSLLRDSLCIIYGKAVMAYHLGVITSEEFMQINHMTIFFINTHARALECGKGNEDE